MNEYILLIRGINVGGKNKVPMAALRMTLEKLGFHEVRTYIASGNVILRSDKPADEVRQIIEAALPTHFTLDSDLIKVLVLTPNQLRKIIKNKPAGFGDQPDKYYCDAIFLIDIPVEKTIKLFKPREGVDRIWPGDGVIYSERLGAERTKSRLSVIVATPEYKSMTIRSWATVIKLQMLIDNN